jgi:hypothetical protein
MNRAALLARLTPLRKLGSVVPNASSGAPNLSAGFTDTFTSRQKAADDEET